MFKYLNNDRGIALIMVIVLLLVVGTLVGALMSASVFNIRFSGDEVERNQAFYAADAGIEYIKSNFGKNDNNIGGEYSLTDEIHFELEQSGVPGDEIIKFTSTGEFNDNLESIKINFRKIDIDLEDFEEPIHGQAESEEEPAYDSENVDLKSWAVDFYEDDQLSINETLDPSWEDWQSVIDQATIVIEDDKLDTGRTYENEILFREGNLRIFAGHEFRSSIIIIDGDLDDDLDISPGNDIKDSIVVVNGNLHVQGTPQHEYKDSLFFVYGDEDAVSINISGNIQNWSFDNLEFGGFFDYIGNYENWRIVGVE